MADVTTACVYCVQEYLDQVPGPLFTGLTVPGNVSLHQLVTEGKLLLSVRSELGSVSGSAVTTRVTCLVTQRGHVWHRVVAALGYPDILQEHLRPGAWKVS